MREAVATREVVERYHPQLAEVMAELPRVPRYRCAECGKRFFAVHLERDGAQVCTGCRGVRMARGEREENGIR